MAYTQNKEFVEFRRSDKNNNKNNIKKSKLIWELPVLETPQDWEENSHFQIKVHVFEHKSYPFQQD